MRKIFALFLASLFLFACKKTSTPAENPDNNYNEREWVRIQIPGGAEASAIAGNISDTLVVATRYNIYLVTENGAKVTPASKNLNYIPGLLTVKDTIFALAGESYDAKFEKHYAATGTYYTLDKGKTWVSTHRPNMFMVNGEASSIDLTQFKLQYRAGADLNGDKSNNWVLQTYIIKTTASGTTTRFTPPIENRQPLNLHIDKDNRLYIATGGSFTEAGVYLKAISQSPAYIYVSKNPV
ncbi:hypothetical protein [Pedobacter africanus]|uniref:Lipoprotein n=1 Tax=Pedobacter africanus TaxID=151894 RepID=A0A1W2B011_9SPHI|nr:hypothetical protein [Pedobacter africanus]SMC66289.1 hypothetical protein SAMN04488524_1811 [Pedobacter africanus]